MSTDTTGTTPADEPSGGPESGAPAPTGPPEGEGTTEPQNGAQPGEAEESGAGREAAGYRRRLRDAEAERDRLAERVTAMQTREVERIAAEHLAQPGDLITYGTGLTDLLDDDGQVDESKATDAVRALLRSRPGLRRPVRGGIGQESGPAGRGNGPRPARSGGWADALTRER